MIVGRQKRGPRKRNDASAKVHDGTLTGRSRWPLPSKRLTVSLSMRDVVSKISLNAVLLVFSSVQSFLCYAM